MLVLAVALTLAVPATAHAALITKNWRVQPKSVVGAGVPVIVNGGGSFDAYPLAIATLEFRVDGAVVPRESYAATTPFTRNLYLYWAPSPVLADGPHTFRVQIADTLGRVSAYEWSATVAQPPTIAWTSPEADVEINNGRPVIALTLADNTPTTAFALAGEVRDGSATGAVVATFGDTGLGAGEQTFTLPAELAPGTYVLTANVTDDAGNTAALAGATARRFTSVAAPAMTLSPAGCLDAGCHITTGHPATGMACADCHVKIYHEYAECQDCHGGHSGPVTVTGIFGECDACHDPAYPWVPGHTPASVTPAHMSSCNGCHNESLLPRHAVTPGGSAYAYQCDLCHASADPRVSAAVAAGDITCGACHDVGPEHGNYEVSLHMSDETCLGSCHDPELGPEHTSLVEPVGCAGCHQAKVAEVRPWDKACAACHEPTHPAPSGSSHVGSDVDVVAQNGCSAVSANNPYCHDIMDLSVTHAYVHDGSGGCGICHGTEATPSPVCRDCHEFAVTQKMHHNNTKYLNNAADAAPDAYYYEGTPPGGWNNALSNIDCMFCHPEYVGNDYNFSAPRKISPNQGLKMWRTAGGSKSSYPDTTLRIATVIVPPAASLDFMTSYDIEADFDYGYVEITTDGSTWTRLPGSITTTTNPYFRNQGNGITGKSAGWVSAHFDLSAYAGQNASVRFRYRTDQYVFEEGWAIDEVVISGVGGSVFSDNAETANPAYTTVGWSLTGPGPALPIPDGPLN